MISTGCRLRAAVLAPFVAVVLCSAPARADTSDDHTYQTWLAMFAHGPLKGNLWLWADVQPRLYESFEPATFILRPGLSWRALPDLYLTAGYAWTPGWSRDRDEDRTWGDLTFVDEHRSWQQILWAPSDGVTGVAAQIRGRFEQRYRPGSSDVGLRLRILWRGHAPISRDRLWIAVVWNELFLGLNEASWGQRSGFDQNRIFVGAGRTLLPGRLRLEGGYTNKWTVRPGPDTIEHILALNLFVNW
jgi:hypothetical protein